MSAPEQPQAKAVIRWVDGGNAVALGYQEDARYPLGRWVLEQGDGWSVDLHGGPGDAVSAFQDAEHHLGIRPGTAWTPMLNGYGDAYTADLPAQTVMYEPPARRASTSTATAVACGFVAILWFPPVLGIIGIIFGAIGIGRGERGAGGAIAFCIAAMLFGMAFGYHTATGYWPWQTVYYYR